MSLQRLLSEQKQFRPEITTGPDRGARNYAVYASQRVLCVSECCYAETKGVRIDDQRCIWPGAEQSKERRNGKEKQSQAFLNLHDVASALVLLGPPRTANDWNNRVALMARAKPYPTWDVGRVKKEGSSLQEVDPRFRCCCTKNRLWSNISRGRNNFQLRHLRTNNGGRPSSCGTE